MGKEVDFVRIDFMRIDLVGVDLVGVDLVGVPHFNILVSAFYLLSSLMTYTFSKTVLVILLHARTHPLVPSVHTRVHINVHT